MTRVCRKIAMLLVVLTAAMPASAQVVARKMSQEAMTLDLDSAVAKRLASIDELVANQQWDALATLLRQTQVEKPDKLIPISDGWYVSVQRYCQCQAALLPASGLAAYREQIDPTAKNWLQEADRQFGFSPARQRAIWLRIIRQAFASSFADTALARLAEQSFEQADYAAARTYWEMLLPPPDNLRSAAGLGLLRYPDFSSDAAQIRAQLVLCSSYGRNNGRADIELAALRRLHPNAEGRLAGRDGRLVDLLPSMTMNDRDKHPRETPPPFLDRPAWSVVLPHPTWQTNAAIPASDAEDCFPVVAEGILFVTNGESVFAFDASTGDAKWSERPEGAKDPQAAIIHSFADPIAPKLTVSGRPMHLLTIHDDRLYARLGTPITGKAKQEMNSQSELVGLDIGEGEGKLIWRVTSEDISPEDPLNETSPWCFDGCPVANSERVFAVLRRSLPQRQINVACFDADTARLLWNRKVGVSLISTDEAVNSTSQLQLALSEDSVFLSTDSGAIVALDANDGTIRWLRTYVSNTVLSSHRGRRDGHTPVLYHDGVLYAAPLDSGLVMAIHAESGLLLWQRDWPDPIQYILGVSNDNLIVQGRFLWGIALSTGDPAWPHRRVGNDDPEGNSFSRGALVGRHIWWPNREQLMVVAADSGEIERRIELHESLGLVSGHLAVSGTSLFMSRGNQVTVFRGKR